MKPPETRLLQIQMSPVSHSYGVEIENRAFSESTEVLVLDTLIRITVGVFSKKLWTVKYKIWTLFFFNSA